MANRAPDRHRRCHGFSLAELTVVVSILAVIAVIVTMNTGTLAAQAGQRASVVRLAKRIDYFRQLAVYRGRPLSVEFDVERNSYRATVDSGRDSEEVVSDWQTVGRTALESFDGAPLAGETPRLRLTFAPDGVSRRCVLTFREGKRTARVTVGEIRTTIAWNDAE